MTSDKPHLHISQDAYDVLAQYNWPGNIRELKNVLLSAISLCDGSVIELENLNEKLFKPGIRNVLKTNGLTSLTQAMLEFEKIIIKDALESAGGNKVKTAKELEISRSTLYEKCNAHGLL